MAQIPTVEQSAGNLVDTLHGIAKSELPARTRVGKVLASPPNIQVQLDDIILTKEDAVFGARRKHTVRLVDPLCHQVIDQYSDICIGSAKNNWLFILQSLSSVYTCNYSLCSSLLITTCTIGLTCYKQIRHNLRFQRRKKI